jgi:WD40 repeat protein/energy-coupling factor transporter ATP-binding protein EcfA2
MASSFRSASGEWPFIGLRPFEEEDEEYFFGREEELNVLKPKVEQNRFVAIVGSSGCGKSSLIRAGLRAKFKKDPNGRWSWIEMRPGNRPIRELAKELAGVAGETVDLMEARADRFEQILVQSKFGIGEVLSDVSVVQASESNRVLLLVDQFEELFRFAKTAAERLDEATAFVGLLLAATKSEQVPIHVMVTMRSDFIGDCARFHGLSAAVSGCQYLVPGMTRDQRADAIRGPVGRVGGLVDAELVQRALIATNEDTDQLPILQHAMMRCWELAFRRSKERPHLTVGDYIAVGGVDQALSGHANEILEQLAEHPHSATIDLKIATKRVFQALTETDQHGRSIRSPQRFSDLVQYVKVGDASEASSTANKATHTIVDRFARHDCSFLRVVPPSAKTHYSNDEIDDDSIIDISHEALIRRWDKLNAEGEENWIRQEEEDAERYQDLLRFAAEDAIIPSTLLAELENWWQTRKPNSFWARQHTKHGANNFDKAHEALIRSRAKEEESQKYETRVLAKTADDIRVPKKCNGAADALAMARNKPDDLPNVAEYLELLYNGLAELREERRIHIPHDFEGQVFALSFAPGSNLLAAAILGNVLFYDTDTGELVHSEKTEGGWALGLRWSPDGKRIYVGTSPVGKIVAVCAVEKLRKYFKDCGGDEKWDRSVNIGNGDYPAGAGAWSRDGKWIVVAGWQRRATIWDTSISTGKPKRIVQDDRFEANLLDSMTTDLAASAERIALGAASGKIHIFDARSNDPDGLFLQWEKSLDSLDKDSNPSPYSLVFNPRDDNQLLATYMPIPNISVWNIKRGTYEGFGDKESGTVWRVAFDPDSEFLVSATADSIVRLWKGPDWKNATQTQLKGHLSSVFAVDISREKKRIASAASDRTIRIWHRDSPLSPKLLSDSTVMPSISNSLSRKLKIQNAQVEVTRDNGEKYSGTLPQEFGNVRAAALCANEAGVAVVPNSGQPVLFVKLSNHSIPARVTLTGVSADWEAIAFIDDDTRIAAKTTEGKIFAWPFYSDVAELKRVAEANLPFVRDEDGLDKRLEVPAPILRMRS